MRIGQPHEQVVVAVAIGRGEQLLECALEDPHVALRRELHAFERRRSLGVELDDRHRLVVRGFAERVLQQRPRVVDVPVDRLRPVQMPQRGVVEGREVRGVDLTGAAHGERPLRLGFLPADDPAVPDRDRARVAWELLREPCGQRPVRGVVRGDGGVLGVQAHVGRIGVGQRTQRHRPVRVVEDQGLGRRIERAVEVQPTLARHPRREAQPRRAVVVAGDHHHRHPDVAGQPVQRVVEQRDCVGRRHRAIVDVAGHDHHVDARLGGQVDELVQRVGLVVEKAGVVEVTA